jgi:hypothetical protein
MMLDKEKWKRLSEPLYREELALWDKAQDVRLTEEEQQRLTHLRQVLDRFFSRFVNHSGDHQGTISDAHDV